MTVIIIKNNGNDKNNNRNNKKTTFIDCNILNRKACLYLFIMSDLLL